MRHRSRWVLIAGGVASLGLLAALLVANLVGAEKKIERRIERLYALDDPRFMHELGVLLGPPFVPGTKVSALLNGDEIFPPMLAMIRAAKVSITFETYVCWSGDIGRAFAEALAERALGRNTGLRAAHAAMRMPIRTCWAMPVAATLDTAQTQKMPAQTIATLVNPSGVTPRAEAHPAQSRVTHQRKEP